MSAAEPRDSQLRDNLLSRLLAESLASPAASGAACPDAEAIAAYAERSLGPEEIARLDVHFADCARCQTVLAALARSLEASPSNTTAESPSELPMLAGIPQINVNRPAEMPAPAPASAATPPSATPSAVSPSKIRIMPQPQPTRWRQLAPALGIAAAVALWFALRPVPPIQNLSAQLNTETYATQTPAGPLPQANNSETAEANIPAAPPPAVQRESKQLSADASRTEALKKETFQNPAAPSEAVQKDALEERDLRKAESAEQPNQEANAESAGPAAPAEPLQSAQATINSARSSVAPQAPSFTPSAAPPAPAVSAIAPAGRRPQILALTNVALPTFVSPSRAVMWRVGRGGSIERSTDQGQTWERQTSGVSADLVAGAAASNGAAWIVGRAGVILRTTDGVHWQRVSLSPAGGAYDEASPKATPSAKAPPASAASGAAASPAPANATALDLAGVEARDALHATVTASDGRRFATADGGNTWTPQ